MSLLSSPGTVFLKIVSGITSQSVSNIARLLETDTGESNPARQAELLHFLETLNKFGPIGKALVAQFLVVPEMVLTLADNGKEEAVLALISAQPLKTQAAILDKPDTKQVFAYGGKTEDLDKIQDTLRRAGLLTATPQPAA